jgi:hypothetical protein
MARRKLSLEKETLRRLGDNELARVAGASGWTCDCPSDFCGTNENSICYTHCDTQHPCAGCYTLQPWACTGTCTDVTCYPTNCTTFEDSLIPPCLPNQSEWPC